MQNTSTVFKHAVNIPEQIKPSMIWHPAHLCKLIPSLLHAPWYALWSRSHELISVLQTCNKYSCFHINCFLCICLAIQHQCWFLQCYRYEESGSTALAGGWAQPREGFPGSCRFETILSAECSTWPPADWSIFKYQSLQTPESLFLFVVKWILKVF